MVAALYVDPRGPYPRMPNVDCWDETRDAKRYAGPHPVVAHPPCGPWSRLSFLCRHQDPDCGPRAVDQVRRFGGVLEHPQNSQLWRHCKLPWPGELPDEFGGQTFEVRQVAWGHCCEKPTWIYVVDVPAAVVASGIRTGGNAAHRVTNGPRGDQTLRRASANQAKLTPPAFAEWLVSLARAVQP
jgi:hypothetical protein